jgi:hypothetical protein
MSGEKVGAILSEIHGLLHEAKSNVEIDFGKGQKLIERLSAAESAHKSGTLTSGQLAEIAREVGEGIEASIEKEMSIDNPEAAVIQIRGLLDRLQQDS